ncbi:MAG: acylneuraminate cytidylyltransferase family protein [Candidatus Scalindua sp.]|jgi:N-acylneuraminate cytidylyltransferase|nr:acylneuraminate cytidylyltransferase family protein [Candidatus Scalindua sp.]MBT5307345.1 acylneuraminate cytidylyltransferase family protein [Candidatus Scalindua sp.]MBT6230182.1 acylneuraminate cytidylyltransferase family protein [Candidatus Scalindua sp.]MBT6563193.1 acylneuraminate cytidylyltransferase family protein [Candidatus Scalindua sp.]MBT7212475.1 acylneuraminate cytidylyltransferase family protein [Candidatus Scalindua sp.]
MVDVVAVIPARSGSKGVPDKNIKLLAGKPLLAYSIVAARLTSNIKRVIVSTDSEHYAEIAREHGAETPFLRPAELSSDSSTDYDVIKHLLDWMRVNEGYQPKYLVYLRPVTPLRDVTYIKAAIERIRKDDDATALRSMHEMPETAYKTLEIEGGYLKCICSGSFDIDAANLPRQIYEKTYVANGYVDIVKSSYVIENEKVFGNRVIAYMTPEITDIDTLEDFNYLEYQVVKDQTLVSRLFQ